MAGYQDVKKDVQYRMDKAVEVLKQEYSGLRAGRAHTGLLDGISVEAYGSPVPLAQVGTIGIPDPRTISVQVWDRSMIKAVEKAIMESSLGLNPMSEGQLIRIPVPPLSQERRDELAKVAAKYAEQAKIAVRNVRRDGMDAIKKLQKDGEVSEDDQRKYEGEVQKFTDDAVKKIDEALSAKEKDIKQV